MKPLAIDLFCGLASKSELRGRADTFVQQLVTGRAKNPDHMPLAVRHDAPASLALKARTMCDLYDTGLAARFAGRRKVWILAPQTRGHYITIGTTRVVDLLCAGILSMKSAALNLRRFSGARIRAVTLIAVRRRYVEVLSAYAAIASRFRDVGLLASAQAALPCLALSRAIAFVRALRFERRAAHCAE